MLNLKLQNMKQAAYFDYFKSFSLNASDTIKKLQTQFKEEIEQSFFFDPALMFKRVKTLLGSYQILIYQINDSCEFVEIPQFGSCILKIFLQIMSVIRFLLHKILQKSCKKQDPSPLADRTNSMKKSSLHMNMTQTNLSNNPSIHQQQKLMYKKKQQSKYIINTLTQQLSLMQMQHSQNIQTSKKQFRSLIQGKEKLQSIEISQNENILSQALNSFCKKGQHLKTFVNVRQAAMISNMKQGVGEYMKVKDILDEDSNVKLSNASVKLQELFKTHTLNYYKQKQSEMVSQQVQVHFQQPLQNRILQENKHIKKLNDIIRKLNDEMGFEMQKTKSIENLLKSKTEQFQLKTMEYRVAKIQMENIKAKHQKILQAQLSQASNHASRQDLCSNCQNKRTSSPSNKKSQIDCTSKSIIEGSEENQPLNSQQTDRKSDEVIQSPSRLMQKMNRRVHYQNPSSLTRKQLAFRQLDSKSDELDIYSLTWYLKIQPQFSFQQKRQPQSKKRTIMPRVTSGNVNYMNNTFNSNRDHRRLKTKMLTTQSKNSMMEIQRVISINYAGNRNSGSNQKLLGIKTFSKKFSQGSSSDTEGVVKQVTQKWLDNDEVNEGYFNVMNTDSKYPPFYRKHILSSQNQRRQNNVDTNLVYLSPQTQQKQKKNSRILIKGFNEMVNKQNKDSKLMESFQKSSGNNHLMLKKTQSKSYNTLQTKPQLLSTSTQHNQHQILTEQDQICNSLSHLSVPNQTLIMKQHLKYPKFIKFSTQQKIILTIKDLNNLFVDIDTAKNFQYINLFQNDDLRVGSAMKGKRKTNQALCVNIQQLQKKNFINGLISRVKGEVASKTTNMSHTQTAQQSKTQKPPQIITECQSMNCTFSGTLMRTQFWNQLSGQKVNPSQQLEHLLKSYDFQNLVAMFFKHLRDLKRSSTTNSLQMTNYEIVRNFLRYPYSSVTLQNDKTFLQKQRQQSVIEYLEVRKILQRVFKLHKNCKSNQCKNTFEKLGMKQFINAQRNSLDGDKEESVLCWHIIEFFESVGILLLPKLNNGMA